MAQATTFRYGEFLILIKTANGPPAVYDYPCGATSHGFNRSAAMNEVNVPDCADPDIVSWLERDVVSHSAAFDFAGSVADESFDVFDAWFEDGVSKDIRVELGDRVWAGKAKLGGLNMTGRRGSRVEFTASLASDGPFKRVVA